jgi:hypothetical protein
VRKVGVGEVAEDISGAVLEFGKKRLDPEVKAWMDNVFVPAMVRLYLAESASRNDNGMNSITERMQ